MIRYRTRSIPILFILLALVVVLSACNSDQGSGNEGDFVLNAYGGMSEIGGESVALDEIIAREDRLIILNFWAGNCPPCRAEMPTLEAAWQEYGDNVLIIGVDIGPYVGLGSYGEGRRLVEEIGVTYPTGNTGNRNIVTDWKITSMPSTFFLNRDGRVHDRFIGAISNSGLSQKIRQLIAANAS